MEKMIRNIYKNVVQGSFKETFYNLSVANNFPDIEQFLDLKIFLPASIIA